MSSQSISNRKPVRRSTHPTLPDINEVNRNSGEQLLTPPPQLHRGQSHLPSPITPTLPDLQLEPTKDETHKGLPNLLSPTLPSPFMFDLDNKQETSLYANPDGIEKEVTYTKKDNSQTLEVSSEKTTHSIKTEHQEKSDPIESPVSDNLKDISGTDQPVSKRKAKVTLEDYKRLKMQNKENPSLGSPANSISSLSPSTPLVQHQPDFELLKQNFIRLLADGKFQKKLADKAEKYSFLFAIDAVLCYVVAFQIQNVSNISKNQPATTSNWRTLPAYIEFFLRSDNESLDPIFRGLFLGYLGIAFREIFNIELLRMQHLQHFLMKDIRQSTSESIPKSSTGNVKNICENAVRLHDAYKRFVAAMKQCSQLLSSKSLKAFPITLKKFEETNSTNLYPPFCIQTSIADSIEFGHHIITEFKDQHGFTFNSKMNHSDLSLARNLPNIKSLYVFGIFGRSVQMTQHRKLETNKQS
ncbi:Ell binding protein Ebp1 [Schizosaccharomyces osmophilus]|uniref:Ell binding protein Ebp1 n=1 Tax=Schizosaccharomyces osmophilus TaxID=2545709 RepID=A0AAE9W805_9SCHI|nr:Ell binding protein Ebp1 [Schizosaccharomyces osmophilus]WBW71094.1 Ell binding protein Ebp1 [Schizosaccharomyces osmophilus]